MYLFRGLLLASAALLYGCNGPQVPPREAVPPYVHWDASYAQPLGVLHSGIVCGSTPPVNCRGGMLKVMFEFPEFDVAPVWVKADVEYPDGASARMDIIVRNCIFIAQAPGLTAENEQVIHLQWMAEGYSVGHYKILVRDYQLRPIPVEAPPPPPVPTPPPPPPPDATPVNPGQLTQSTN